MQLNALYLYYLLFAIFDIIWFNHVYALPQVQQNPTASPPSSSQSTSDESNISADLPTEGTLPKPGRPAGTFGPLDIGTVGTVGTIGRVPGNDNVPPLPPVPPDANQWWMDQLGVKEVDGKLVTINDGREVENPTSADPAALVIKQQQDPPPPSSQTETIKSETKTDVNSKQSTESATSTRASVIPTNTSAANVSDSPPDSLPAGVIAGIVIGSIVAAAVLGTALLAITKRVKKKQNNAYDDGDDGSIDNAQIESWKISGSKNGTKDIATGITATSITARTGIETKVGQEKKLPVVAEPAKSPIEEDHGYFDDDAAMSVRTFDPDSISPSMAAVAGAMVAGGSIKSNGSTTERRKKSSPDHKRVPLAALFEQPGNEHANIYENEEASNSEVHLEDPIPEEDHETNSAIDMKRQSLKLSSPESLGTPSYSPQGDTKSVQAETIKSETYAEIAAMEPSDNASTVVIEKEVSKSLPQSVHTARSIRSQKSADFRENGVNDVYDDDDEELMLEEETTDLVQERKGSDVSTATARRTSSTSSMKRQRAEDAQANTKHVRLDDESPVLSQSEHQEQEVFDEDDEDDDDDVPLGLVMSRRTPSPPPNEPLPSPQSDSGPKEIEISEWEEPKQLSDDEKKHLEAPLLKDEEYVSYLKGLMEQGDAVSIKSHASKLSK